MTASHRLPSAFRTKLRRKLSFSSYDVTWEDDQPDKRRRAAPAPRDNWYRDDWFNRQEQWERDKSIIQQQQEHYQRQQQDLRYERERDLRQPAAIYPTRDQNGCPPHLQHQYARTPSPHMDRAAKMAAFQHHSLDRNFRGLSDMVGHRHRDFSATANIITWLVLPQGMAQPRGRLHSTLSQSTLALREAAGIPLAGGRRLPKLPQESQKPLFLPQPQTPLPLSQKPERLSTRNRRLPQIPVSAAQNAHLTTTAAATTASSSSFFTNPIVSLARRLTGSMGAPHGTPAATTINNSAAGVKGTSFVEARPMQNHGFQLPAAPPVTLRSSQSFNNAVGSHVSAGTRRPGRGAKLPAVPTQASGNSTLQQNHRRRLPERGGFQSR